MWINAHENTNMYIQNESAREKHGQRDSVRTVTGINQLRFELCEIAEIYMNRQG